MSSYAKVKSNKLVFKGDTDKKKKKKRKRERDAVDESNLEHGLSDTGAVEEADEQIDEEISIVTGTGRMTSSGCTIYGHGTKFSDELSVGDAIIVMHPTSLMEETKIVTLVLSNVSISVSSTFSSDLISTTSFRYVKAPKSARQKEETEEQKEQKKRTMARESEEAAFGIYAGNGGQTFTYRTKNPGAAGTYKIVTEKNSSVKTREEMLDMRTKKKADRFCY